MWDLLLKILKWTALLLLLAGLIWQGIAISENFTGDDFEQFKGQLKESPTSTVANAGTYLLAKDLITPMWTFKEWIGNSEHRTPFLEAIPFLDGKDAFILLPFWLLAIAATKLIWNSGLQTHYKILATLALWIIGTLAVYVIWKVFLYYLMIDRAEKIGIDRTTLTNLIESEYNKMDAAIGAIRSLMLSALFFFVYTISQIQKKTTR